MAVAAADRLPQAPRLLAVRSTAAACCCCWRCSSPARQRASRAPRAGSSSARSSSSRRSWPSWRMIIGFAGLAVAVPGRHRHPPAGRCCSACAALPMVLIMLQPDLGTDPRVGGRRRSPCCVVAGVKPRHPRPCWRCSPSLGDHGRAARPGCSRTYQKDRLTTFVRAGRPTQAYRSDAGPRLQPRAVQERHRLRRRHRQGPVRRPADPARLRARAADRLHLHRGGRAARLRRARPRCSRCSASSSGGSGAPRSWPATTSGCCICVGVLAMLLFQIFENVGMTMGIMPITGIPLPFMSYGGSSLLTTLRRPSASCSTSTCAGSADRSRADGRMPGGRCAVR